MYLFSLTNFAQTTILKANAKGNTYQLINRALAPKGDVVETPDCAHPDFGEHITEEWDETLQSYVFNFHIHTNEDNDRCKNFDRQRTEIKTYGNSPKELLGYQGETVIYKWKFKLDASFQASYKFTHLHQIKAVGGSESGMPLITLTARQSSPDKLQLLYADHKNQKELTYIKLSLLKGKWIEAKEKIVYGEKATASYQLTLTQIDNDKQILDYSNENLSMWKTDAKFLRPKWGIYRSILDTSNLRNEIVKFADFSIEKMN
ncbi:Polysaccharide lyase [Salegentibacter echinorum]|uniref:Polysaccharide lyase n=1 Tax=Salegentibacter echinorum TaxID=1073325 RepID=A0A1M5HFI9_SALEC|nr:Polysaccharide lyase [Salegentibacter echinorum]